MPLQSGLYEIQSAGKRQWAGLGAVPMSDPPPPVALKGLQETMKGDFEVSHQGGNNYHIVIPGMDKSELRSDANTVKLMPFAPRQIWVIEPTRADDSYLIKDQKIGVCWTLIDGSDSWGTLIKLQEENESSSQEWKFITSQQN